MRAPIDRTNNFKQAGERYRTFEDWERDDLINNLVDALSGAIPPVQQKMIELFTQCDEDYGRRVREGLDNRQKPDTKQQAVDEAQEMAHEAQPY